MPEIVDLRSDTVTRPSAGMRAAMASAEVGDDVYGEDPTVIRLQELAAELTGQEAALFTPTGVMANQIALRVLAAPGTEVVVETDAHLVSAEAGAGALLAGVQFRTIDGARGILTPAQVAANLRPDMFPLTTVSMVSIEQTHNLKGGAVYTASDLTAITGLVHERGLTLYLDGARVFNAAAAAGVPAATFTAQADGVMFCTSKGLGAPMGSLFCSTADTIAASMVWRRRYGGAMRQSGIVAAAGLYALENNIARLQDDHANARTIATFLADAAPGCVIPEDVETNILIIDTGVAQAGEVVATLRAEGVLVGAMGPHRLRAVTHLDVSTAMADRAARAIAAALEDWAPRAA